MKEKIAAIDLGSNSFHIVIVEINPESQSFKVLDRARKTVRFGTFHEPNHKLSKDDIERGIKTLKKFKELASEYKVSEIIACATSAIREAKNGKEFLLKIKDELEINASLISGLEEARLIYLGVLSGTNLNGKKATIVDIGGGSTELIVGDKESIYHLSSTKLGAVRLTEKELQDEKDLDLTIQNIEDMLSTTLKQIKQTGFDFLIGTSGTVQTLSKIHYRKNNFINDDNIPNLNGYKIPYDSICSILKKMIKTPKEERSEVFNISKNRAKIILAGTLILKVIMKNLKANEIIFSDRALREGLIVDRLLTKCHKCAIKD